MEKVKRLRSGEVKMTDALRELNKQFKEDSRRCEFCGSVDELSFDHIIPHVRGGSEIAENLVLACRSCNSSKGKKGLYEWYGLERKDELPRVAAGKYLKLL